MIAEKNPKESAGKPSWLAAAVVIGLGVAAMLVGAFLLLVPVRTAEAAARDFAAADTCAPGLPPREQAQCLSRTTATVERDRNPGIRHLVRSLDVVHADGRRQVVKVQWHRAEAPTAVGEQVRLVAWRGEIRSVEYGPRLSRTAHTVDNPYTGYAVPFGWGAFLLLFGPAMVWMECWQRWLSGRTRRAMAWQFLVPLMTLVILGVSVLVAALISDLRFPVLLRWTAAGTVLALLVAGAVSLYKWRRGEPETYEVEPRRDERERVFRAVLLGDEDGVGDHLVIGPGVLAFSIDPTGSFRRKPLPDGLVLERVRPVLATDPGGADVLGRDLSYRIAQCRDGEREVLIAVRRRDMPWLVGALTEARPAGVAGR
ncbi:hypothetical protein [Streptomyces sp. NPDC048603]|uniref:hypothetical protein n=1 Tax=Streptomyces sp. NPDC048603 TaxID=3365577 RepID=UPI00371A0195